MEETSPIKNSIDKLPPEKVRAAVQRLNACVAKTTAMEVLSNKALGVEVMDKLWCRCSIGDDDETILSEVIYRLTTPWWKKFWHGIAGR